MNVVAHNIYAMNANRMYKTIRKEKQKTTEKLSSGYRINRSADDAAGLQISEKMRQYIRGLDRGRQNTMEGISWLQIADGAMNEAQDMVQRIRELAIQAANGTNSESDRAAIDQEIQQIKEELDHISDHTVFNEENIFTDDYITMDVEGNLDDLEVFDAAYDDATGEVTYGGFIFHGYRISWDTISKGMVGVDGSGKQVFRGGSYTYKLPGRTEEFSFKCERGDTVPKITRTINVTADRQGVKIDGKNVTWNNVKDENGKSFSDGNAHSGKWTIDYEGVKVRFFLGTKINGVEDMIRGINACKSAKLLYTWNSEYINKRKEQAVDLLNTNRIPIRNILANSTAKAEDVKYIIRAGKDEQKDENGIWLETEDENGVRTKVNGSYKSWKDLKIDSWFDGDSISDEIIYTYRDVDANDPDDTLVSFSFSLSDVTSVDSVIDGLDDVVLTGSNLRTNYTTNVSAQLTGNIKKLDKNVKNPISFENEKELGRDFDQQKIDNMQVRNITYDDTNNLASVIFTGQDAGGNAIDVFDFQGDTAKMCDDVSSSVDTYLKFVLDSKKSIAVSDASADPQTADFGLKKTLTDLLGAGNITTSGYFDGTVVISSDMKLTDGKGWAEPGEVDLEYPRAYINFSSLADMDSLVGLGFNSTCKTCNNHYSVMFVNSVSGGEKTDTGYKYKYKESGNDHILQIDVNSLKNNGVNSGTALPEAMIDILSECFDFHYTQYAATKDGILYIYDNRSQNSPTQAATFDTAPYNISLDTDTFDISLKTDDERQIDLNYTYNFNSARDCVEVNMKEASGITDATATTDHYIKIQNGSKESYVKYDPNKQHPDRVDNKYYTLDVAYKDVDGNTVNTITEAIDSYTKYAVKDMLENTQVEIDANDYTYVDLNGEEKPNTAIGANFESTIVESFRGDGLRIQHSGAFGDETKIPRVSINSIVLNLERAGGIPKSRALDTLKYTDYAIQFLSEKRSLYGAYQNRLESTYDGNWNTQENMEAAESRIRDADMAVEIVKYSMQNIVEQASQSVLAQANQSLDWVLQLI